MYSTETTQIEPYMKTKVNTNTNTEENPKTTEKKKLKKSDKGHRSDLQILKI